MDLGLELQGSGGAGDGNRTRTVSLGIVLNRTRTGAFSQVATQMSSRAGPTVDRPEPALTVASGTDRARSRAVTNAGVLAILVVARTTPDRGNDRYYGGESWTCGFGRGSWPSRCTAVVELVRRARRKRLPTDRPPPTPATAGVPPRPSRSAPAGHQRPQRDSLIARHDYARTSSVHASKLRSVGRCRCDRPWS